MAINDIVFDQGLAAIETNCTRVDLCTTDPGLTFSSIAAASVANYVVTSADFTIANGDTSGRKITLAAQSGNNGTATGAANFAVFSNGTDTVYLTIPGDGDTVNSGSPVNIAETNIFEMRDPS